MSKAPLLLQRLKAHGVSDLQIMIVTHLHPDHASAYFRIKEAYPNVTVYHGCKSVREGKRTPIIRWLQDDLKSNPNGHCLEKGQKINWLGLQFQSLWPSKGHQRHLNDDSIVLFGQVGAVKVLLMADASSFVENRLLANWNHGPVDLYVAGHHGAKDTGLTTWLEKIQPQWSLVSVDKNNHHGYPSGEVVKRLKNSSLNVRLTSESGEVCLDLDKRPLKLCKD